MAQPAITCPRCPAVWTGTSICHCGACHRTFSGIKLFDNHRRGGRCTDPVDQRNVLRCEAGVWRYPERDASTLPLPRAAAEA